MHATTKSAHMSISSYLWCHDQNKQDKYDMRYSAIQDKH